MKSDWIKVQVGVNLSDEFEFKEVIADRVNRKLREWGDSAPKLREGDTEIQVRHPDEPDPTIIVAFLFDPIDNKNEEADQERFLEDAFGDLGWVIRDAMNQVSVLFRTEIRFFPTDVEHEIEKKQYEYRPAKNRT